MNGFDENMTNVTADDVGVSFGALPVAPMVMPRQVLEQPLGIRARLAAVFGQGVRTRGIGH